jgi:hypothetical protein
MIIIARKVGKLTLLLISAIAINGAIVREVGALENEPLEVSQQNKIIKVERQSLCKKFPQNSNCQKEPLQVIKIRLDNDGEDREWIRIDKDGNTVKLLYTKQVKNFIVSSLFKAALSFIPGPTPFSDELTPRQWKDRQTTRVAFKPDGCSENTTPNSSQLDPSSCMIAGNDTLVLPEGTNIRAGLFMIEYTEGELIRSITFRIPAEVESEIVETVEFEIPSRN